MSGSLVASLVFAVFALLIAKEMARQHQIFLHGFVHHCGLMYLKPNLRGLISLMMFVFTALAVWFMPSWIGRGLIIIGVLVWMIRGLRAADRKIARAIMEDQVCRGMSEEQARVYAEEWIKRSDRQTKRQRELERRYG